MHGCVWKEPWCQHLYVDPYHLFVFLGKTTTATASVLSAATFTSSITSTPKLYADDGIKELDYERNEGEPEINEKGHSVYNVSFYAQACQIMMYKKPGRIEF